MSQECLGEYDEWHPLAWLMRPFQGRSRSALYSGGVAPGYPIAPLRGTDSGARRSVRLAPFSGGVAPGYSIAPLRGTNSGARRSERLAPHSGGVAPGCYVLPLRGGAWDGVKGRVAGPESRHPQSLDPERVAIA